jgi:glycerophosphoryl diester phosphodiesterase
LNINYIYKLHFLFLTAILFSCAKEVEKAPIPYSKTKIIAHRGSGSTNSGYALAEENTLEAIKYGFLYSDGVEIDIQMSKDNTIWLFHDMFTKECDDDFKKDCVPTMTDDEIIEYSKCKGVTIDKLESVFEYHIIHKLDKIISLDVKSMVDIRCKLNMHRHLNKLADELINLIERYPGIEKYLFIESDNMSLLKELEEYNDILTTYLLCTDDYESAFSKISKTNINGVSMYYDSKKINETYISKLRSTGHKSQIWIINDKDEIKKVSNNLQPDYIQTDNFQLK